MEAVLFDYGVVLSGPPQPDAWTRMKEITELGEAELHPAYWGPRHDYDRGTLDGRTYWQAAGRSVGVEFTVETIAALISADTDLWTGVNQPMVDWAARLQAAGTPTGILSNLGDAMEAGVLASQRWLGAFEYALWSHRVKMTKPDKAIYALAAKGLRAAPGAVFFIDDRAENVEGALRAGMQAILYADQGGFEKELADRGLQQLWHAGRAT